MVGIDRVGQPLSKSRLFDVEVTVANQGQQLRAGMIATVTVVEQAAPRPLPACATRVSEGMVVATNGPIT